MRQGSSRRRRSNRRAVKLIPLLSDIARRFREAGVELSADDLKKINLDICNKYGGDWYYIRRTSEVQIIARNNEIIALWEHGPRDAKALAARFNISERQVRRIVNR